MRAAAALGDARHRLPAPETAEAERTARRQGDDPAEPAPNDSPPTMMRKPVRFGPRRAA